VAHSVKITPVSVKERIPDSLLRKFVEDVASGANLHDAMAAIAVLDIGAAIAPALAAEVLGLRPPILRVLSEGCPKAGRLCAWCGTDLAPERERHRPECPWLAIVNASSWLDGIQASFGTRTTDTERLERTRELVRIVFTPSARGVSPIHLEEEAAWSEAQQGAYEELRREIGLWATLTRETARPRPRQKAPPRPKRPGVIERP
jgi:hypothetical protein